MAVLSSLVTAPAPVVRPDRPTRSPAAPDAPAPHDSFRPDIEGLRAVAVLAVLGFHAAVPGMAGGFVGVDLFFVISGFLITGLLLDEHRRTGAISFGAFYARRARRILPAAAVVLVAVTAASYALLPPLRRVDVMRDVLASATYGVNWRFIQGQTDYLAASRDPSPLLHFWSLAVEEQFYIVWPLLILALAVVARWLHTRTAVVTAFGTAAVVVGSYLLSDAWTQTSAPLAYLSSPSRAWQFGAGALVAALIRARSRRPVPGPVAALLGWGGVALVAWSVWTYDTTTVYPGSAALAPTLGGVLLVATGAASGWSSRLGPSRVLARRPVRWVGRLSYSLYLWHWPVIVLAQARRPDLGWPTLTALVLACAVPAWLTMRLVEDPVRRSRAASSRSYRGLAVGVTACVVPVTVALAVGSSALAGMDRAAVAASAAREQKLAEAARTGDPFVGGQTSGAVTPAVATARKDTPHYPAECIVGATGTASPECVIDPETGDRAALTSRRVVLIGDSHAGQWFPVAAEIARRRGLTVEVLNKSGCPLADVRVVNTEVGREFRECDVWRAGTLRHLATEPAPALVLMSSLNRYVRDEDYLVRAWSRTLGPLRSLGAPLVYLADTPFPDSDVPACVSGALQRWSDCSLPRATALRPDPLASAVARGSVPGVTTVDVNRWLCPPGPECPAVRAGVLLYRDESHVTDTAMTVLAPGVDHVITARRLLPAPADSRTS